MLNALKEKGDSLLNHNQALSASAQYEAALETYRASKMENHPFLFELLVNLSYTHAPYHLALPQKQHQYLEEAQKLVDAKGISPIALSNFYQDLASLKRQEGDYEKGLGYVNKAYEICSLHRNEIAKEVGVHTALDNEAFVRVGIILFNMHLDKEEELLKSYAEFEHFYLQNHNQVDLGYAYGQANFFMGRFYQKRNVDTAVDYFDRVIASSPVAYDRHYAQICKGHAYIEGNQMGQAQSVITSLESIHPNSQSLQLNILELAAKYYSEIRDLPKLVEHVNTALGLLNKKNMAIDIRQFNPDDFEPIENPKYPVLLTQFITFLESVEDESYKNAVYHLYKIALNQ
ncbi:MAG: hypothetical protein AB3N16_08835, partial [Flavobacteriaceae bacterium]